MFSSFHQSLVERGSSAFSVLLMGLIYRERHGPGNIGLESVVLLVLYFGGVALLPFVS